MSFNNRLNSVIDYVESHLDGEIDRNMAARLAGMSFDTLQRVFPHLAGLTLADYVRRRRMTLAGKDLVQSDMRVIDLATKYGYGATETFSRAFRKFHGVKPSAVRRCAATLRFYPKLTFDRPYTAADMDYKVVELENLQLYGWSKMTDLRHIREDAPQLYDEAKTHYAERGHPDFGMLIYHQTRESDEAYEYWVLWRDCFLAAKPYAIAAARWLKITVSSQSARDIQDATDSFYERFLPACGYRLRPDPELEYYHDDVTDLLIPIY